MAMKARGSGVWPVYDDFKPTSEWQQDALSHNLIVSLPGFLKEQLRVSTEGRNIIRVRGERLISSNKWSRFLEDFEVPENSDMNSVRAKFHEGALTITIPKKVLDKPHEPTPEKEVFKGSETQDASGHPNEKQKQGQPDVPSTAPFRDAQDAGSKETSLSKEKHGRIDGKEGALKKTGVEEEMKPERSQDLGEDETRRKMKLKTGDGAAGAATYETKQKGKEGKPKRGIESSGVDDNGAFTKKALRGLAHLSEERQLMVNMGAAVLVIVALSAYVTYKFVSADDNK
ncbi:HSP20-like chaperones superfamily protein [Perilla frutescens var. frutescens]|nr:HSP20-like chaperones superfamily protein [Perilla frutescens var. frutescens]